MSSKPANRPLRLPPANLSEIRIPRTCQPEGTWFRAHQSIFQAICFCLNPGHRFSHPACKFPLLYVGVDPETSLFECFGDTAYNHRKSVARSIWNAHGLSTIQVPELQVCDLANPETLSALMTDLSALMHPDLGAPQAWGWAIQAHPETFQGIKYYSRFNGKVCLALFLRDGIEDRLRECWLNPLPNDGSAIDWLDSHGVSLF